MWINVIATLGFFFLSTAHDVIADLPLVCAYTGGRWCNRDPEEASPDHFWGVDELSCPRPCTRWGVGGYLTFNLRVRCLFEAIVLGANVIGMG